LNTKNQEGFTPLHLAAQERSAPCIEILVDAGARKNVYNADKLLPVDLAPAELKYLLQTERD
jgi:ankyrin repeat protein